MDTMGVYLLTIKPQHRRRPIRLPDMDIIHQCLSLAPVPYLSPAFSVLRFIWSSIQQVQASQRQLEVLAQSIAQLLETLNEEYRAGRLLQAKTSSPLKNLRRYVGIMAQWTIAHIFIVQAPGRNITIRSEGSIIWISQASFHQRSKDRSDREIPPTYWHFGNLLPSKSPYS
jgi:hypothetical protein